jgi:outer membrane protein
MKWWHTVGALLILIAIGAAPRAEETVGPSDAREPVRLTLAECIGIGLENNPELGISKAQIDQAKGQVTQAKAKQYPTVKFSANAVRTNMLADLGGSGVVMFNSTVPTSGGVPVHVHQIPFPNLEFTQNREGEVLGAKIEAQYALYTAGMIKNGVQLAKLNETSAEKKLDQKRNELLSKISQAFYGVLLAQQMVKVVDDGYKTATAHYEQVQAFYKEGIVSDLDVVRTEAKLAEIRPIQIDARNGLWMARLGLNNYLNIDLDTPVEAVGSIEYEIHPLALPEDLYQTALTTRSEVKVVDLQMEMAKRMLAIAKAGGYPMVGLFANYQWNKGQETPPNDKIWRDGYQAGVAVQLPLFDGFETQGKVAEAEAMVRQVVEGKRALELGIRTQVQQSIIQLRSAEEKIKAQDANVRAAQKNHEAVTARYAAGLSSNLEVMDAESALLRANTERLQAVYNYNVAWVQLQAALGNLEGGGQ